MRSLILFLVLSVMMMPVRAHGQNGSRQAEEKAQEKTEEKTMHHAAGTFTVKVLPLTPAPAEGLGRFSIDKEFHGDLEATTKGEMFSAGDPKTGAAGYVAIEVVTGTLSGKKGSFALQQMATMSPQGMEMKVLVVPGSGTGELKGISGTFSITVAEGKHSYAMEYELAGESAWGGGLGKAPSPH